MALFMDLTADEDSVCSAMPMRRARSAWERLGSSMTACNTCHWRYVRVLVFIALDFGGTQITQKKLICADGKDRFRSSLCGLSDFA
jgi:hypothetical protein